MKKYNVPEWATEIYINENKIKIIHKQIEFDEDINNLLKYEFDSIKSQLVAEFMGWAQ